MVSVLDHSLIHSNDLSVYLGGGGAQQNSLVSRTGPCEKAYTLLGTPRR